MYLIKRILDFILSLIALIILLPVFLIIGLAIKLDSKGPIFFKQERLGKDGEVFLIYKFRTMIDNAEKVGSGIYTSKTDPRITKVGAFLRRTSLDELPQLINVLKGEMSIVGPRPPVPYHPHRYENYPERQKQRFTVLPGITGYAQVNGRNNLTWDERIEYDIEYVENYSLLLDLKIIFKTIGYVFSSKSIYSSNK